MWSRVYPDVRTVRCRRAGSNGLRSPGGGLRGRPAARHRLHEVTGFLVDRQDPRDLAASVNHLLRDSFLRRSLGTGGRNRAVARYSWDRIAVDTARLYEKSMSALAGERTAAS